MDETKTGEAVASHEGARTLDALPEVATVDEVAKVLRINRKTLYAMIKDGDFPARFLRGTIRISRESVREWLRGEGRISSRRKR